MKATLLIRKAGLKGRMEAPEAFLRRMNRLSLEMTQQARRAGSKKGRKRVLRQMKTLVGVLQSHARVIVRGKAGAEVEFGNTALLGENRQGIILDYQLFRESAPADTQILFPSLVRVMEATGKQVEAVVGDRGFASASNSSTLRETDTFDALCPRKPSALRERMREERFARLQRRRAQTEGRIGILKHGFLGLSLPTSCLDVVERFDSFAHPDESVPPPPNRLPPG